MTFEAALPLLKEGYLLKRSGWKNVEYIRVHRPEENSKMTVPYIYACFISGELCPWLASQKDVLANDWDLF